MTRYHVTDRHTLGGMEALLERIARNVALGIDLVQIREKDLSTSELCHLTRRAVATGARVLVNSRVDVAIACGAAGIHLPANAIRASKWRSQVPREFLIGISCHHIDELDPSADFAVFGPIFPTPSKAPYGPAQGLERLQAFCASSPIPVFALGGVTRENADSCLSHGAAGIAGITLFQSDAWR